MMKKGAAMLLGAVAVISGLIMGGLAMTNHQIFSKTSENQMDCYTESFLGAFDTKTDIVGYAESEADFTAKVQLLKDKLMEYHRLFDIYNDYENLNNIKTINDHAGIAPVAVDAEIIEMLKLGQRLYEETDGQVNIAMGSVLSIWHDYRKNGMADPENAKLPPMAMLESASHHTDIHQLIIDEAASTVYLSDASMSLDVGGIGKGYAVQKLAEYAREIGFENALLSVGGNVCAVGPKMNGSAWKVGILNPDLDSEESCIEKVDIKNQCVVTSGNYQRYYMVDGQRYCHIIDPDTLMPADHFASVSIITGDSGMADALSTALYNMSLEEGMSYIRGIENACAVWVMNDGAVYYSDNFETYIRFASLDQ